MLASFAGIVAEPSSPTDSITQSTQCLSSTFICAMANLHHFREDSTPWLSYTEGIFQNPCVSRLRGITNPLGMVVRSSSVVRRLFPSKDSFASRWKMMNKNAQTSSSFHLRDTSAPVCFHFVVQLDALLPVLMKRMSRNPQCVF